MRSQDGEAEEGPTPEEQLAALEAELEALEELALANSMEAGEELGSKVDKIFDEKMPSSTTSGIAASRGPAVSRVGKVAVCGLESSDLGKLLLEKFSAKAESEGSTAPQWLELSAAARQPFEEVDALLEGCQAAIVCVDTAQEPSPDLSAAKAGLKAVLSSSAEELSKVVLLSRVGAQAAKGGFNVGSFFGQGGEGSTWADLEDELTSTARTRSSRRRLRAVIIRAGTAPTSSGAMQVRCLPGDEGVGGVTSYSTLADATIEALAMDVNTPFAVVEEQAAAAEEPQWAELLLPFVGPEVWRAPVTDAKKAVLWIQGWADEFFGKGKPGMRFGVKTPVVFETTPSGVIFKFKPLGSAGEGEFDQLSEGGVDFVVEEPEGAPARLRAVRCGYGWKVSVKENSESALVDKLRRDWEEVAL